ncbi:hypothetical protein AAMO2058_000815800 [Amorphochlora amoebiformis]
MATELKDDDPGSTWWSYASSALNTVSDTVSKGAKVAVQEGSALIQSAQEDLTEFAATLSSETVEIKEEVQEQLEKVSEKLRGKMENKNSETANSGGRLVSLSDNIESMFGGGWIPSSSTAAPKANPAVAPGQQNLTPGATKLAAMQSSETSFTTDPTEAEFPSYLKDFGNKHETELKGEVLKTLNGTDSVRVFYTSLVPKKVTEQVFWARYFFRVTQLDKEEQRRKFLLARLNKERKAAAADPKPTPSPERIPNPESASVEEGKEAEEVSTEEDKGKEGETAEAANETREGDTEAAKVKSDSVSSSDQSAGTNKGWIKLDGKTPPKTGEEEEAKTPGPEEKKKNEEGELDINKIVEGLNATVEEAQKEDECWVWE